MSEHAKRLAHLLADSRALLSGDFQLKDGSRSEYFIDFGRVEDGTHLELLGRVYADAIAEQVKLDNFDVIFGPAYKGIPLAVAIAMAFRLEYAVTKRYCFNRKVAKGYGDKRPLVGSEIRPGDRVLIVDDVFSSGTAKVEAIEFLREQGNPALAGVFVGVDRSRDQESTIFAREQGVAVQSICTLDGLHRLARSSSELKGKLSAGS